MKKQLFAMVTLLAVFCSLFSGAVAMEIPGFAGAMRYPFIQQLAEPEEPEVHITHYRCVNVRSGPSTGYRVLCEAAPGESYPYLGTAYGWHCIELRDGRIGYVSNTLTTLDGDEWAIIPY